MSTANVTYGERHGWTIVHIAGGVDLPALNAARERLLRLIWHGCRHLVVDLAAVHSCEAGLFAVLAAARRHMSSRGGEFRLVLPAQPSPASNVLAACGVGRAFAVYVTAAEAVADGGPPAGVVAAAGRQRGSDDRPPAAPIPQQRS
ncbi:STAS domain-containing protein [Kitasatospora sp. NPDC059648]|uniref:STAS domain-containing protein n=1 Tax=Kitasatospora sp. NPDC059648 TaxID=3346894 RepID=UPI0036A3E75C